LEVLVCEKEDEKELLREYFKKGGGRDLDDFDVEETSSNRKFVYIETSLDANIE
jgi:hypothetical protein